MLADRLGWVYLEADDFHSAANKAKMHSGMPLTEADRMPWLKAIHAELLRQNGQGRSVVLACSALRDGYRRTLMEGLTTKLVYLCGSRELIAGRLRLRTNHFAGEAILDDQFAVGRLFVFVQQIFNVPRISLQKNAFRSGALVLAEVKADFYRGIEFLENSPRSG